MTHPQHPNRAGSPSSSPAASLSPFSATVHEKEREPGSKKTLSLSARARMAPETATSPKKAEAAAAGAPASYVWRSCRLICLIFAARLYCCAPPSLAEDTWPWVVREATPDETAGNQVVVPEVESDGNITEPDDKVVDPSEPVFSEMEFVNSLSAGEEVIIDQLPFPQIAHGAKRSYEFMYYGSPRGELDISTSDRFDKARRTLGGLEDAGGYLRSNPHWQYDQANLHTMDRVARYFMLSFKKDPIRTLNAASFAEKARGCVAKCSEFSSMTWGVIEKFHPSALTADIRKDSDGNIELRVSFPSPKKTIASAYSCIVDTKEWAKRLSWDYVASFEPTSDGLRRIKDSLTLKLTGDSDEHQIWGKWIYDEDISRTFDDANEKPPKGHYNSTLQCFQRGNKDLKYDYTWKTELNDKKNVGETFVGRVHVPLLTGKPNERKNYWLKVSTKKDGSNQLDRCIVFEKGIEIASGWKLHNYFIEKRSNELETSMNWNGAAWSRPSNVVVDLDKIPLDTYAHRGICQKYKVTVENGDVKSILRKIHTRYSSTETSPSNWLVSTSSRDVAETHNKKYSDKFTYTSEDLKALTASSEADAASFDENKVALLKDIFAFPLKNEEITQPSPMEVSELSVEPCTDANCSAINTSYKQMALGGTLVVLTALTLLAFANLIKSPPKVRKDFLGTGRTTCHL